MGEAFITRRGGGKKMTYSNSEEVQHDSFVLSDEGRDTELPLRDGIVVALTSCDEGESYNELSGLYVVEDGEVINVYSAENQNGEKMYVGGTDGNTFYLYSGSAIYTNTYISGGIRFVSFY